MTVGPLVVAGTNELGVGRIVSLDDQAAKIEYFDTPGQDPGDRYTEWALRRDLRPYTFVSETRVFFEVEGQWHSGRVDYQSPDGHVAVRVNDGERMLHPETLHVRWDRPLADPANYARVGLFESPHNYERRAPVLRGVSEQLRATRGMPGLLSVSAELHPHQVTAARRVLDDHTQRYLLADEVGLGKTIEALLVLRQLLLDNPSTKAELIVPDHLIGQWQSEIESKLLPGHFPWAEVRVSRHSDPAEWEEGDVLVVDEAHGLVLSDAAGPLRQVAHASPRLLLLSATPALHNEERFLEMLHLLDPVVYPRDGIAALRTKVEARRDLGRALVGLVPDAPSFALAGSLKALRETLAGEDELLGLLDAVEAAHDSESRAEAISDLRGAVADVFQVHRRMIRNRRTDDLVDRFPIASRHGTSYIDTDREVWQTPVQALEAYGEAAAEAGASASDALTAVVNAFPDVTEMRSAVEGTVLDLHMHTNEDAITEVAREIADALTYEVGTNDNPVVFAPTPRIAHAVTRELKDLLGPVVATLVASDPPNRVRGILTGFAERPGRWLICDPSIEEGANLQTATVMAHIGLPGRVDRLEQRIGRIDRWTAGRDAQAKWRSLTFVPPIGLMSRWSAVVDDGFGVHSTSLASLQRAVEETSANALMALADSATDPGEVIQDVQERLEAERTAVREQDAIDEMTLEADERAAVAETLDIDEEAESPGAFSYAFGGLMTDLPGNLRFIRAGNPISGVGRFEFNDPAATRDGLLPLVPLRRLRAHFLSIKEQGYAGRRAIALAKQAAPIRIGTPVVDAIENFLRHDDRGRAWAMWRYDPEYEGATRAWWRIDLLVRATVDNVPDGIDSVVLQRQLDGVLPPTTMSIWATGTTPTNVEVTEPIDQVLLPYRKSATPENGRMDRYLRPSRLAVLDGLLKQPLAQLVDQVRDLALETASTDDRLMAAQSVAIQQLEARARRRGAALRRRRDATPDETDRIDDEARRLQDTLSLARGAIREPNVGIDAIGLIVLSSEWPWGTDEADT